MDQLAGKRVVIMGLGRFGGGAGAARFCARHGAKVLVTDTAPAARLADSLRRLEGANVRYRLGGHDEADFTGADLIVVNPAVDPRRNRYLAAARRAGVRLTTEIALLLQRIDRRRLFAVTGTAGKSTTTAMIGHALRRTLAGHRVRIGGNLGGSLLDEAEQITDHDWIVLELSSFMLEALDDFSPHVAIVTNLAPNHLDRHGSLAAYIAAKQRIIRHQTPDDHAVLGPGVAHWAPHTRARVHVADEPPGDIELLVPGRHNHLNAALAIAACRCIGVERDAAAAALADFPGLEHRLRLIAEHAGVRFFDDSKATTPEAAILAIDCFTPRTVHAILGGFDKGADLAALARHAAARCAGVYTIGQTGERIAAMTRSALADRPAKPENTIACAEPVHQCADLRRAVAQALQCARAGEVILLSPGCASWDRYENYEARGQAFSQFALQCVQNVG